MDNLGTDEAQLASKIERKQLELDRNAKRLSVLQNVKPAFMEEYERVEVCVFENCGDSLYLASN